MESSDLTSPSRDLSVSLILEVTNSLAETITELDGLNGIAMNLLIVGLLFDFISFKHFFISDYSLGFVS